MTTIRDLPQDVLHCIANYLDAHSQLQTALCSRFISRICIQRLWHTPNIRSARAFNLFLTTLYTSNCIYPYHDWLKALNISLLEEEIIQDFVQGTTGKNSRIQIKKLNLTNVHGLMMETSKKLLKLFIQNNIKDITINHCSNEIISSLINTLDISSNLTRISIEDCHISDGWVNQLVNRTPQLRYFSSERSGYLSDNAISSITQNCPFIETVIVTLPNHIIQSNTITMISLQSISQCQHIKQFICRGQVRIARRECQDWLYTHCPTLEYCDLSFSSS